MTDKTSPFETLKHDFVQCQIIREANQFMGLLSYKGFDQGTLTGDSVEMIRGQFDDICQMIDNDGGMLRRGCIMLGYHNDDLKGYVLLPDGEIIGSWAMEDDDEMSHFTLEGETSPKRSAPSAWMLQDAIGNWLGHED